MRSFRTFGNFCDNTSLHGWAHFYQSQNSKLDKLFWALTIVASCIAAFYLNERVLKEFLNSTVVLKLDSPKLEVKESKFPRITMKNAYKLRYSFTKLSFAPGAIILCLWKYLSLFRGSLGDSVAKTNVTLSYHIQQYIYSEYILGKGQEVKCMQWMWVKIPVFL